MRRRNEEGFGHRGRLAHPVVPREVQGDVALAVDRVMVVAVDLGAERIGPEAVFRLPDTPYRELHQAVEDFYGVWVGVNPPRMRVLHNPDDESLRVLPTDLRELIGHTAAAVVTEATAIGEDVLGPETRAEVTAEMQERVYRAAIRLYGAWVHENPDAVRVLHNPMVSLKRRLTNLSGARC